MEKTIAAIMQHKTKIVSVIGIILIILFAASCYGKWNEIWHVFGQNLYHLIYK